MVPVLMYHIIDDANSSAISVSEQLFADHIRFLQAEGYRTLSLQEYVGLLTADAPPPERSVFLTFDDGYVDVIERAAPVLREAGFNATVFVLTHYCGELNWWNRKACYLKRHMSWAQVRQWVDWGFDVGAHTCEHQCLTKLDRDSVRREMAESQSQIEECIRRPVRSFSYPYGNVNALCEDIARELFDVAFSVNQGFWDGRANAYRINRLGVDPQWTVERLAREVTLESLRRE